MLTGSPSSVLTLGLGSWGSTGLVLTLGFGAGEQGATLVGQWSNVLHLYTANERLALRTANQRLDIKTANERLEL